MGRHTNRPRINRRTEGEAHGTERLVVAGPNAVEAVLGVAAPAGKRGKAASVRPASISAVHRVYLEDTAGPRARALSARAHAAGIPISMMGRGEADRLSGARCQGIAAEVGYAHADLDDLLAIPGLVVFLDGVADPHNLGAILRTAEAAGATGVVIPERRAAGMNATVMRVSAGAGVFLPVARVTNLVRSLQQARHAGFWIIGLAADGADLLTSVRSDARVGDRLGLVVGGEGEGMHRLVAEHCDQVARLPMRGRVESLNASVAAAVAIYGLLGLLDGQGGGPPVGRARADFASGDG